MLHQQAGAGKGVEAACKMYLQAWLVYRTTHWILHRQGEGGHKIGQKGGTLAPRHGETMTNGQDGLCGKRADRVSSCKGMGN